MAELPETWWEARREPVQLALEIPIGPDSDSPKPPKVTRSCFINFGAVVLRLVGIAAAAATLALGAWAFYQVPKHLGSLEEIVRVIAQGIFLVFLGGLSLLAELRTRWTMRGCLETYILFANYLARGIIYVALGAIIWALPYYDPPVVKQPWVAGGILAVGVLNILFYPFYWKHERELDIYNAHAVALEPYPEEIIYGMDVLYIKKIQQNLPTVSSAPVVMRVVEGATEVSPSFVDKLEKETPGGPDIHLVVDPETLAPAPAVLTSSTCAEQLRHSVQLNHSTANTTVVEPTGPIGVGAS